MFKQIFIYNTQNTFILFVALMFVLSYEIINGFHDTANSVVTLIYTKTMGIRSSVIISGIFNFFGVLFGGLSVAYAIVHLLPVNLLMDIISINGLKVIFSILLSSIIWNLITWYFGLPSSSSHTLIGSIIGIGLLNSIINHSSTYSMLNISEICSVLLSLVFSPFIGLFVSGVFILLLRKIFHAHSRYKNIHMTPFESLKVFGVEKPPFWIRFFVIFFSIGVSYAHGSNDGQKGIGLIMLVLIGIMPGYFVLNLNTSCNEIVHTRNAVVDFEKFYLKNFRNLPKINYVSRSSSIDLNNTVLLQSHSYKYLNVLNVINYVQLLLDNISNYKKLNITQRINLRYLIIYISNYINQILKNSDINSNDRKLLNHIKKNILNTIEYAPTWIVVIVAIALALGTILGWKRVTLTIGEKIGRKSMTYAQGISSQITASCAIIIASYTGVPVSTTHIISSSIAGSMLFDRSGLRLSTIKNIFLTWILTLPISIILSTIFYLFLLKI